MQNRCGRTQKLNRTLVACTTLSRVDILVCPHALSQSLVETPRQINFLSAPRAPKHQVFPVGKFRQARRHEIQTLRRSGCATVTSSALSFIPANEADRAIATPPRPSETTSNLHVESNPVPLKSLTCDSRFRCQRNSPNGMRAADPIPAQSWSDAPHAYREISLPPRTCSIATMQKLLNLRLGIAPLGTIQYSQQRSKSLNDRTLLLLMDRARHSIARTLVGLNFSQVPRRKIFSSPQEFLDTNTVHTATRDTRQHTHVAVASNFQRSTRRTHSMCSPKQSPHDWR